jgi:hypothetical protein
MHLSRNILHHRHSKKLKGKKYVKLPVCLTKHHAVKMYCGSGGIAPHSLTSALDGG